MASSHTVTPQIKIDEVGLRKHYNTLTKCQQPLVRIVASWIKKPRKLLVIISGGPGTGKSYLVKNTLDCLKVPQVRMSYTARSAAVIGGKTIHSTLKLNPNKGALLSNLEEALNHETDLLKSIDVSRCMVNEFRFQPDPYVVVVDEISMINGWLMYWIIHFFMNRTKLPLLFICMGDPHQLNPIKSIHNLFNVTLNKLKCEVLKIHLKESKRFVPEYEEIVNNLRAYVDVNDEVGMFTYVSEKFPIVQEINETHLMQANRAIAFKNVQVQKFNSFYLNNLVEGPEIVISDDLVLKPGCMIFVTKNGCSSVPNGTLLIFERYDSEAAQIIAKHPKNKDITIKIGIDKYSSKFPVDLGFAGTVHKFQGDTIDDTKIVISFNENKDLNLVYTALSRVRQMEQILAIEW